jgi:hypothetical protein
MAKLRSVLNILAQLPGYVFIAVPFGLMFYVAIAFFIRNIRHIATAHSVSSVVEGVIGGLVCLVGFLALLILAYTGVIGDLEARADKRKEAELLKRLKEENEHNTD